MFLYTNVPTPTNLPTYLPTYSYLPTYLLSYPRTSLPTCLPCNAPIYLYPRSFLNSAVALINALAIRTFIPIRLCSVWIRFIYYCTTRQSHKMEAVTELFLRLLQLTLRAQLTSEDLVRPRDTLKVRLLRSLVRRWGNQCSANKLLQNNGHRVVERS